MSHQNNETRTGAPAALSHSADAIASGRLDTLARWLIRRAAAHTPPPLAERLEEEWLADLTERRSSAARLRLALGCCWATSMIARDRRLSSLAIAGGGSTSSRSIATYLPHRCSRAGPHRSSSSFVCISASSTRSRRAWSARWPDCFRNR